MAAMVRRFLLLCVLCACNRATQFPLAATPPPPAARSSQVVVIGGGLGGLVSAYELQKRGISATVLEASDVWGGRVATAYYPGGASAESGLQEIWKGNPLNDIAKELGVAFDEESDEAYSSLVIDGKLIEYGHRSADAF